MDNFITSINNITNEKKDFMERNIKIRHKAYYDNRKIRYDEYFLIELKIQFIMF